MFRNLMLGLSAAAVLSLSGLTPAFAMIPICMEQPNAETCPYAGAPTAPKAAPAHVRKSAELNRHYRAPTVKRS